MKDSFKVEILKPIKTLTTKEQNTFRLKFKPLLKLEGIMSLCLEAQELYVEFDPALFKLDSFKIILKKAGFPLKLDPVLV